MILQKLLNSRFEKVTEYIPKGVKNKHQKVVNKEKRFNLNLNQLTLM